MTNNKLLIYLNHQTSKKILSQTAHRPWPLPNRRWTMAMRWHDLLFAHWPISPDILRPLLPPNLELDTFDGQAWIGIVPFRMSGVRLRYMPEFFSFAFPELNVRTYVTTPGRPGVWFFSLDATNRLAVRAARLSYALSYFDASMLIRNKRGSFEYLSYRTQIDAGIAALKTIYKPTGDIYHAKSGSLDHWLTERYALYSVDRKGRLLIGDIHHQPWPLQSAEADFQVNTMTEPLGVKLPDQESLLHFALRQDMVAWKLKPV